MFTGLRAGGDRAAAIYTVIQTFKAISFDPEAHVTDVVARVAEEWPASRSDEIMPCVWQAETDQSVAQAA